MRKNIIKANLFGSDGQSTQTVYKANMMYETINSNQNQITFTEFYVRRLHKGFYGNNFYKW